LEPVIPEDGKNSRDDFAVDTCLSTVLDPLEKDVVVIE
jgi:hypothetical protein